MRKQVCRGHLLRGRGHEDRHRWSPHLALQAACADGALYTLTVPGLQLPSKVSVFPDHPASLLCSPDCQWVFAWTQDSELGPKVSAGLSLAPGPGFVGTGSGSVPDLPRCTRCHTGPGLRPLRAARWAVGERPHDLWAQRHPA